MCRIDIVVSDVVFSYYFFVFFFFFSSRRRHTRFALVSWGSWTFLSCDLHSCIWNFAFSLKKMKTTYCTSTCSIAHVSLPLFCVDLQRISVHFMCLYVRSYEQLNLSLCFIAISVLLKRNLLLSASQLATSRCSAWHRPACLDSHGSPTSADWTSATDSLAEKQPDTPFANTDCSFHISTSGTCQSTDHIS